ncbi:hypothetical protein GLOTRDRAFT_139794 [Gloeophyllum trabeum ATCC 11539]|uniref:Uncharacterized protein n=1 Tax=Gloeophyllum trabeum (strain ATCC 11539 / FP-39264 / Madison 617) TaxID=670483 RepID=S7Q240_GLOTA|nr:uncharacterized protein GLOTRDRAFT_139794 [Gloeophyllum trabeum ATCC 11539]EPQ53628.1 hypothetical protein GLOTRDRAFT_139794 [Gloeophyllum trabeum ATCC 11539]
MLPTCFRRSILRFLLLCLLARAVSAQAGSHHKVHAVVPKPAGYATNETSNSNVVCRPFGRCEPCPDDALHEPFCQPFGNRRLMHCQASQGETPAWQSCGRIPEQERADFYEFVACNLAFALVALGLVVVRTRRMEAMLARRIAARIGLVRGG